MGSLDDAALALLIVFAILALVCLVLLTVTQLHTGGQANRVSKACKTKKNNTLPTSGATEENLGTLGQQVFAPYTDFAIVGGVTQKTYSNAGTNDIGDHDVAVTQGNSYAEPATSGAPITILTSGNYMVAYNYYFAALTTNEDYTSEDPNEAYIYLYITTSTEDTNSNSAILTNSYADALGTVRTMASNTTTYLEAGTEIWPVWERKFTGVYTTSTATQYATHDGNYPYLGVAWVSD